MSTQHTMFDAVEPAHKRGGQICAWLPWSQWANYHSHTIMLWQEFILWIHGDELLFLLSKEKNDSKPSLFHYLFFPGPIATNVFHWTDSAAETITKSTLWPGWKNRMNTPSLQPNYRKSSISLWVLSWWIEAISNFFFFRFSYLVIRFFSMRLLFFYVQHGSGKVININRSSKRSMCCFLLAEKH